MEETGSETEVSPQNCEESKLSRFTYFENETGRVQFKMKAISYVRLLGITDINYVDRERAV